MYNIIKHLSPVEEPGWSTCFFRYLLTFISLSDIWDWSNLTDFKYGSLKVKVQDWVVEEKRWQWTPPQVVVQCTWNRWFRAKCNRCEKEIQVANSRVSALTQHSKQKMHKEKACIQLAAHKIEPEKRKRWGAIIFTAILGRFTAKQ